jgi:hypothetical protein
MKYMSSIEVQIKDFGIKLSFSYYFPTSNLLSSTDFGGR